MRNLIIKLTLIAVLVIVIQLQLVYSDSSANFALWHCDAINWSGATGTNGDLDYDRVDHITY